MDGGAHLNIEQVWGLQRINIYFSACRSSASREVVRILTVETNKQRPRVLVVDDERTVADTLKLILNNAGYDTRTAYSGETAVEMLREFEPEMLITDVIMPGISGIDAAIKVCEALPACKVLLISGNETAALLHEAARTQNYDFELLAKPFHPTLLIARMRSAMGY